MLTTNVEWKQHLNIGSHRSCLVTLRVLETVDERPHHQPHSGCLHQNLSGNNSHTWLCSLETMSSEKYKSTTIQLLIIDLRILLHTWIIQWDLWWTWGYATKQNKAIRPHLSIRPFVNFNVPKYRVELFVAAFIISLRIVFFKLVEKRWSCPGLVQWFTDRLSRLPWVDAV